MKNLIILTLIAVTFNACSVTSHNKVNSNLELETIPVSERKTYEVFGKERFIKPIIKEDETLSIEDSLSDEYANQTTSYDPLESYNRVVTSFNDYVYLNILTPTAEAYAYVVHEDVRIGISNFFHNITFPVRFINNVLQFKFENAGEELGRFVINSTAGVLGFMDPAKEYLDLNKREEDFGQTLGYYGLGEGFHLVLPFYGPSNLRDTVGMFADSYVNPLSESGDLKYKIPDRTEKALGITLFKTINSTSLNLGQYEKLRKDAIDIYPFFKNAYTQSRENKIKE